MLIAKVALELINLGRLVAHKTFIPPPRSFSPKKVLRLNTINLREDDQEYWVIVSDMQHLSEMGLALETKRKPRLMVRASYDR